MPVLTSAFCKTASSPLKNNKLHRCSETRGLALCLTPAGHRSFVFCYSAPTGQERRMTIGELGPWSLQAARKRVAELRRQLDCGIDPLADKKAIRGEMNLASLWFWYEQGAFQKLSMASQRDQRRAWAVEIEPRLGAHTKVSSINRSDVQRLIDDISQKCGGTTGNRCHSYFRRMLNLALNDKLISENPALNISRNREEGRERYLSPEEMSRLMDAIHVRSNSPSANAIALLLLTGARRGEVLEMRWGDIDLNRGIWRKPSSTTKQRRSHVVPLSEEAVVFLNSQSDLCAEKKGHADWVFPSKSSSGHLSDVKREWKTLCHQADISDARLHDLRHSYASLIVSNGGSLEMVGALLGHSQPQTTKRYAHLYDDPLRKLTGAVGKTVRSR